MTDYRFMGVHRWQGKEPGVVVEVGKSRKPAYITLTEAELLEIIASCVKELQYLSRRRGEEVGE